MQDSSINSKLFSLEVQRKEVLTTGGNWNNSEICGVR
jgi:hypothetical protein